MIERFSGTVLVQGRGRRGRERGAASASCWRFRRVTLRDVPAVGEEVTLFTHLHVREDAIQLFGFSTEEERELFRLFIGVSKIGPKLALAALSARRAPRSQASPRRRRRGPFRLGARHRPQDGGTDHPGTAREDGRRYGS